MLKDSSLKQQMLRMNFKTTNHRDYGEPRKKSRRLPSYGFVLQVPHP